MALPTSQKQWILGGTKKGLEEWKMFDGPIPKLRGRGILVKMHAAAINYREILIPDVCTATP